MFDRFLFRGTVIAAGETLAEAAAVIGCHPSTISRKMAAGEFTRAEIERFRIHYNVPPETVMSIFFAA